MVIPLQRSISIFLATSLCAVAALLGACAGSGKGLDANGNPIAATASGPAPLAANFQSIQDNVFTPICTRCHSGASAPQGLQLDQAHSYALLVGVPSSEVPSLMRVKAGAPDSSYLIEKLQGSSGIVGVQMPFGGPYLPQATIDVIRQWITNGAAAATTAATSAVAHEIIATPPFAASTTMPADGSAVDAPLVTIAIGFNQEPDASFLHAAVQLQSITAQSVPMPVLIAQAEDNPSTVLLTPLAPLPPGVYQVTVRGGSTLALASVEGEILSADFSFIFTVEKP